MNVVEPRIRRIRIEEEAQIHEALDCEIANCNVPAFGEDK
jgi:hypothetical protein